LGDAGEVVRAFNPVKRLVHGCAGRARVLGPALQLGARGRERADELRLGGDARRAGGGIQLLAGGFIVATAEVKLGETQAAKEERGDVPTPRARNRVAGRLPIAALELDFGGEQPEPVGELTLAPFRELLEAAPGHLERLVGEPLQEEQLSQIQVSAGELIW
jgi:hypothetical protein